MGNFLRTAVWMGLGAVLALASLEVLLHFLPVAGRGVYAAEHDPAWPIHHLLPNSSYTYSSGWMLELAREGGVNNMGYVAPFDYESNAGGVAVLGDSYIESLMNDYGQTLQGRLPGLLGSRAPVMQFGSSGASMPDYLAVARLVADRFHPAWGVVLLTEMDFVEGFAPEAGNYGWDPHRAPPVRLNEPTRRRSFLASWGRRSAVVRYIRYNLKIRPAALLARHPAQDAGEAPGVECAVEGPGPDDEMLVAGFAEQLPKQFGVAPEHVVVVFDSESERREIYSPGPGGANCETRDSRAATSLRHHLADLGVHVVETRGLFAHYYRTTHRRVDHSPADWHWNGEAHRLVAEQVAAIINAEGAPVRALQSRDAVFTCGFPGGTPALPGCLPR